MGMLMFWSHFHTGSVLEETLDKQADQNDDSLLTSNELSGLA